MSQQPPPQSPPQMPAPATILRSRGMPRPLTALIVVVLLLVVVLSLCSHRESAIEKQVGRIVESVQRNDTTPVAKEFNALAREKMTRERVGHLSDQIAPLGKVKSVVETTPKGATDRRHTFVVHFERADWTATMSLDADGKVTGFYMKPQGA